MAQQEVGKIRKLFFDLALEGADVIDQVPPRLKIAVFLRAPGGEAVAQMVVARHGEAMGGKKSGKGIVAQGILTDPVDQLHHPFGLPNRKPEDRVDLMNPVAGGIGKFFSLSHGKFLPDMVYFYP